MDPVVKRIMRWTCEDDVLVLQHVSQFGSSRLTEASGELECCPALAAARWRSLLATNGYTNKSRSSHWSDAELAAALQIYHSSKPRSGGKALSLNAVSKVISRVLPRSPDAVKSMLRSKIIPEQQALEEKFSARNLPKSLEGLLGILVQDESHTRSDLDAQVIAASILQSQGHQFPVAAAAGVPSAAAATPAAAGTRPPQAKDTCTAHSASSNLSEADTSATAAAAAAAAASTLPAGVSHVRSASYDVTAAAAAAGFQFMQQSTGVEVSIQQWQQLLDQQQQCSSNPTQQQQQGFDSTGLFQCLLLQQQQSSSLARSMSAPADALQDALAEQQQQLLLPWSPTRSPIHKRARTAEDAAAVAAAAAAGAPAALAGSNPQLGMLLALQEEQQQQWQQRQTEQQQQQGSASPMSPVSVASVAAAASVSPDTAAASVPQHRHRVPRKVPAVALSSSRTAAAATGLQQAHPSGWSTLLPYYQQEQQQQTAAGSSVSASKAAAAAAALADLPNAVAAAATAAAAMGGSSSGCVLPAGLEEFPLHAAADDLQYMIDHCQNVLDTVKAFIADRVMLRPQGHTPRTSQNRTLLQTSGLTRVLTDTDKGQTDQQQQGNASSDQLDCGNARDRDTAAAAAAEADSSPETPAEVDQSLPQLYYQWSVESPVDSLASHTTQLITSPRLPNQQQQQQQQRLDPLCAKSVVDAGFNSPGCLTAETLFVPANASAFCSRPVASAAAAGCQPPDLLPTHSSIESAAVGPPAAYAAASRRLHATSRSQLGGADLSKASSMHQIRNKIIRSEDCNGGSTGQEPTAAAAAVPTAAAAAAAVAGEDGGFLQGNLKWESPEFVQQLLEEVLDDPCGDLALL